MKLIELELSHFRGIKHFKMRPDGKSIDIFGDNRKGKSTVAHAFSFLITGKDMENREPMAFGIKYAPGGEVEHGLDYKVRAIVDMDGDRNELERIYRENWVRSRGKTDRELKSHFTVYKINGDEVLQKEYNEFLEKYMDGEQFKILTNPEYFSLRTHWTDRQNVLFNLIGKVTDRDVMAMYDKYTPLMKAMEPGETVDDVNERLSKQRRKWNTQIKEIPVRIDTLENQLEEVRSLAEVHGEIAPLEKLQSEKTAEFNAIGKDSNEAKIRSEIRQVEQEKQTRKNELENEKYEKRVPTARAKVSELSDEFDKVQGVINIKKQELRDMSAERIQNEIIELEADVLREKEKEPDEFKKPGACPTCGQDWPSKDVAQKQEKHQAYVKNFNRERAERLKELNKKIKDKKAKLVEYDSKSKVVEQEINALQSDLDEVSGKLDEARTELSLVMNEKTDPLSDSEYLSLVEKEQELNSKLNKIDSNVDREKQAVKSELDDIKEKLHKLWVEVSEIKSQEKMKQSVKELNAERDELSEKLAGAEQILFLIEDFIVDKAEFITEKVNDKFELVNWKLFEHQVNGGINDKMCEAMLHGNEFAHLSTSEKIIAGLDIIKTLSLHYGKQMPVFVDNMESVRRDSVKSGGLQIINLIFDESYSELTVSVN